MTPFEKACALAETGVPVFPCHGSDKRPACERGFLAATTTPDARWWGSAELIGMPTGPASGYDVLDIDPKNGGAEWLAQNLGRLPPTRTHETRSGGLHFYFRAQPGLRNSAGKLAPGVDVRADGGYVVRWDAEGLLVSNPDLLADWPAWTIADLLAANETAAATGIADLAPPSVDAVVDLLTRMPNPPELGRDPWVAIGLAAVGCVQGAEAVGLPDAAEAIKAAWLAWSAKWIGADPEADERRWDDDFSTRGRALAGWSNLLRHATNLGVDTLPITTPVAQRAFAAAATPAEAARPEPTNGWRGMLLTNDDGDPRAVLANAMIALRHAPAWRGVLSYNGFNLNVLLAKCPPWTTGDWTPRKVTDTDVTNITYWLQTQGIMVGSTSTAEAAAAVAEENTFHPVKEYLDGLAWDRTPRIDTWLMDHLGAEDTPINRAFGARFLISAVARIRHPGCQVDTVLTLEGAQGIGKSTAARILAADWFTDTMPDLSNKDALIQLQGRWIIEQAEMDRLKGAEASRVKAFITSPTDVFRPPFGRVTAEFPRQCVFLATVNPGANGYLQDETGARRFWPVLCGATWPPGRTIDAGALRAVRDHLWAEAQHRYRAGAPWHLDTPELVEAHEDVTDERFERDPWHKVVRDLVRAAGPDGITLTAIMDTPQLGIPPRDQTRAHTLRLSKILTKLGCKTFRANRAVDPTRARRYALDATEGEPAPAVSGDKVVPLLTGLLKR